MTPILPTGIGLSPVRSVDLAANAGLGNASGAAASSPGGTIQNFGDLLGQAIESINGTQATADAATTQLLTGQSTDISAVMIDMQKAKTTLDLAVQVRNKSVDAYNELMHTTV